MLFTFKNKSIAYALRSVDGVASFINFDEQLNEP